MPPKSILFVCTGNTCRSPTAEILLRHMLKKEKLKGIEVFSRGTLAWDGAPLSDGARKALMDIGIEPAPHKSKELTKEDLEKADLVLVMTEAHKNAVEGLLPDVKAKTRLLGPEDIADPMGGSPEGYEKSRIEIQNGLRELISELITARRSFTI